jgi:hypothetical protein
MRKRELTSLLRHVASTELLYLGDTADCGPFVQMYADVDMSASTAWGLAAMFRYFSDVSVWKALVDAGAVPGPESPEAAPNERLLQVTLKKLWQSRAKGGASLRVAQQRNSREL